MQSVAQPGVHVGQHQRPRMPLLQHGSGGQQLRHAAEVLESRQTSCLALSLGNLQCDICASGQLCVKFQAGCKRTPLLIWSPTSCQDFKAILLTAQVPPNTHAPSPTICNHHLLDATAHSRHRLVPLHQVEPAANSSPQQPPVQLLLPPCCLEGVHARPHKLFGRVQQEARPGCSHSPHLVHVAVPVDCTHGMDTANMHAYVRPQAHSHCSYLSSYG